MAKNLAEFSAFLPLDMLRNLTRCSSEVTYEKPSADCKDIDSRALCLLCLATSCEKSGGKIRRTSVEKFDPNQSEPLKMDFNGLIAIIYRKTPSLRLRLRTSTHGHHAPLFGSCSPDVRVSVRRLFGPCSALFRHHQ